MNGEPSATGAGADAAGVTKSPRMILIGNMPPVHAAGCQILLAMALTTTPSIG
jgi:hypothetical protein